MLPHSWPVIALWLVLLAYWAASAARAKRSIRTGRWWRSGMARAAVLALVVITWLTPASRHALLQAQPYLADNKPVNALGLALCALGVGLAILRAPASGGTGASPCPARRIRIW